jgi:hypothetical protein
MRSIFLALPHYGTIVPEALPGLILPTRTNEHRIHLQTNGASLLAHNFNLLWCQALNSRREKELTHFAMHHADIGSPPGWLDTILAEMERVDADMMSVVVPIKDKRGLSSTAVFDNKTQEIKRLTMKEIFTLPETFTIEDAGHFLNDTADQDKRLLLNTGLWAIRFDDKRVEQLSFTINDQIINDSGRFKAHVFSEDWLFSLKAHDLGLRLFATRKVPVTHQGGAWFNNREPWGTWDIDHGLQDPPHLRNGSKT